MMPTFYQLRTWLHQEIADKAAQGHEIAGLAEELGRLPNSYDALHMFAQRVAGSDPIWWTPS